MINKRERNHGKTNFTEDDLKIDKKKYLWTKNVLEFLEKILKVNIKLHNLDEQIKRGDIFVFNHFSRLETFIPQYLFNKKEGVFCRSIAANEFFVKEKKISRYLTGIGAVPNDQSGIIDFMAREILKDLKIIIFPEGGMIKDKKVLDRFGRLSVYVRELNKRREPHTGPAIIAIKAQRYKDIFLLALKNKDWKTIDKYRTFFPPDMDIETITKKCREPVNIVPVNITFYPLRITENVITRIVDMFADYRNVRLKDELYVESNILFKDTDMDFTFGTPIPITSYLTSYDRRLTNLAYHAEIISNIKRKNKIQKVLQKIIKIRYRILSIKTRDDYMGEIYRLVTINPLHIASEMLFFLFKKLGKNTINKKEFDENLYMAIKILQHYKNIQFHRDIYLPERYYDILSGTNHRIESFFSLLKDEKLIQQNNHNILFMPNLIQERSFDEIRMKNTPQVIRNEIQPIHEIREVVNSLFRENHEYKKSLLPDFMFEDESKRYQLSLQKYKDQKYDNLNIHEKNNISGAPFLLKQSVTGNNKIGILLVHGFSSSPAEMRYIGDGLYKAGYTVLGIRLEGHGTSPYDLAKYEWADWYSSVERGYNILSYMTEKIVPIGFSMGGSLVLHLASFEKPNLSGAVVISSPIIIRDPYGKYFFLLPIINKINDLVKSFSSRENELMNFVKSEPENPQINYKHMPLKGIYELMKLINTLRRELKDVSCPILIIHADKDYEIDPESARIIYNSVKSSQKTLYFVKASNHVIINKNNPDIIEKILDFLKVQEN